MAKRERKPKEKQKMAENRPAPEPPAAEPRQRYGSFYEAWANVQELRKFTQRHGAARLGLNAEDAAHAQELLEKYKNG